MLVCSKFCTIENVVSTTIHVFVFFSIYFLYSPPLSYVMAYDEELANALGMEDDRNAFAKFYSVLYDLVLSGDGDQCNAGNVNYDNNNDADADADAEDENEEEQEEDMDEDEEENEDEEDDREEENDDEDDGEEENEEEDDGDE